MIKVIIVGAGGRMGKEVSDLISRQSDMEVVGGVEVKGHPEIGKPLGKGNIVGDLKEIAEKADVVVEFALAGGTLKNLEIAAKFKKPYIIGTTGFSEREMAAIETASKKIPVVFSPNFSIGVNLLFKLTEEAAKILGDSFDAEIVEVHHNKKKDAPSGTAKKLAEILKNSKKSKKIVYGREGIVGERSKDEIGVLSVRAGDVVGEHTVIFAQEGERVELVHRATSRLAFAQGVIKAIRFIIGKPAGFFGMKDVVGTVGAGLKPAPTE
jgi:4-hydroxy-tetrahydrodipicolinate reductase